MDARRSVVAPLETLTRNRLSIRRRVSLRRLAIRLVAVRNVIDPAEPDDNRAEEQKHHYGSGDEIGQIVIHDSSAIPT